jgi:hypothetical protein
MQATIFDFTFQLRHREQEIYISRSTHIIMSQDFRIFLIINHPKSFAIRASIVEEGVSQEQVNDFFLRNGSPYTRGIGLNGSMFGLTQEEGFNYQPRILMRRTTYFGVIIGRLISNRGFICTDRQYLLRKSVLYRFLNLYQDSYQSKYVSETYFDFNIDVGESKSASLSKFKSLEVLARGRLTYIKKTVYYRIIGERAKLMFKFSERTSIKSFRSIPLDFQLEYPQSNFGRLRTDYFLSLSITDGRRIISGVRHKYAIIYLEKNIRTFKAVRSSPSRIIKKG